MALVLPLGWLLAGIAFVAARWLVVRPLGARRVIDALVPPAARWAHAGRARRIALVVAGPAACWALAGSIFAVAFAMHGTSHASARVDVVPDGAAATAGLLDGDRIVSIDGAPVADFDGMRPAIAARDDDTVDVAVDRGGSVLTLPVLLREGKLGVKARMETQPMSAGAALVRGFAQPARAFAAVADLVGPRASRPQLAGPVAIVAHMNAVADAPGDTLFALGALIANVLLYAVAVALVLALLPARMLRPANG